MSQWAWQVQCTFIDVLLDVLVVLEEIILVVIELVDRHRRKRDTSFGPTTSQRTYHTAGEEKTRVKQAVMAMSWVDLHRQTGVGCTCLLRGFKIFV